MEIKEPKFKVGDRVTTPQKGREVFGTIARIKFYDFPKGTYIYTVKFEIDGFTEELYLDELVLDSYTYKPKTVWDLKEREECYSLTICGNVHHGFWDGSFSSIAIRDTGGIFLTKEEAENDVERRKIENEMLRLGGRRKINELNSNVVYTIQMHFGLKYVYVRSFDIKQAPIGLIFFNCRKQAIKALETIGEDKVKKYIFGVEPCME